MRETKGMADEANKMGQQVQERVQIGFETASRSFSEANKGFRALATEMTEYSKAAFDDAIRTWEQLIGVKSLEQAMQDRFRACFFTRSRCHHSFHRGPQWLVRSPAYGQ